MQFLPAEWAQYGVDANGAGFKDPYNPADAIFAAARYLRAAGGDTNIRAAVFSYNHSQAYVELGDAARPAARRHPAELLGAITGLTEARFPVHAAAHFSDGFPTVAGKRIEPAADARRHDDLLAGGRSRDRRAGRRNRADRRLAHARAVHRRCATRTATPTSTRSSATCPRCIRCSSRTITRRVSSRIEQTGGKRPNRRRAVRRRPARSPARRCPKALPCRRSRSERRQGWKRLPPFPEASASHRARAACPAAPAGAERAGLQGRAERRLPAPAASGRAGDRRHGARSCRPGRRRRRRRDSAAREPHMLFQIRPAGAGAPLIDPKPILDGWVALENTLDLQGQGREPVPRHLADGRAGAARVKAAARAAGAARQRASVSAAAGARTCRPAGSTSACWRCSSILSVSGLKPTVSGLQCAGSDGGAIAAQRAQRARAAMRWTSPRSTACRSPGIRAPARSRTPPCASC